MKYRTSPDGLAWFIYFLLYRVMRYRYTEVIQNLSRSFPEKSYGEIKRIAVDFYRHFSRLFAEIPVLMMVPRRRIRQRLVLRNSWLIEEYEAQGRPVIIMLGHYGNWECMSLLPPLLRCPVYAVFKPLSNRFFDRLMKRVRSRFGLRMLAMDEAPRHLLHHSVPGAYIFIADQSAPHSKHVVDFLHQPTRVITGAERLAKAVDAAVVYAVIHRRKTRQWEISFSLITDQPAAMAPFEITRIFNARLEKDIRQSPAYWLWTHRRWKTNLRS
ncbi:lysophospholipid acyltransferase family protein [Chitinophaga sp. G-6-1-13]|uniref:Lysophospholipid acyltransferase family protein n=1 Tax=Chitinophaga fulva TaxID=2728842 RepID=A0A848GQC3_9BACT|nr:lysophospholipid acyltransferase family protein [Chitinophaga fulva]NML40594.1 lysophospholipid acyltransferase family protein [Chitinophaga fulva]